MKFKNFARGVIAMLLADPAPASPRANTDEVGFEGMNIFGPESQTPNYPEGQRTSTPNYPRINYVPGNKVKANYLAWANYDTKSIDIAAFDEIMGTVKGKMKDKYGQVRDALHRYILNHEMFELEYEPQSNMQHGEMEARNLDILEATDSDAYMAGLALHKKRMKDGSRDEKAFSKATSRNYDLGKAFKRYDGEGLDEMVGLVTDVVTGKPTYQHQTVEATSNYVIKPRFKADVYALSDPEDDTGVHRIYDYRREPEQLEMVA